MRPTSHQAEILHSGAALILVDANAGATKTTTLAFKAAQEVRNGMSPGQILGLTYTHPAVAAFKARLRAVRAPEASRIRVCSFNALCIDRLEKIEGQLPYYPAPNSAVYRMVAAAIANARRRAEAAGFSEAFGVAGDGTHAIPGFLLAFRRLKGTMALQRLGNENRLTPHAAASLCGEDYTLLAVLQAYERLRLGLDEFHPGQLQQRAQQGITSPLFRCEDDPCFDMAVQMLSADPIFAFEDHPLRLGLRLILLDEGHDLNEAMFTVLQRLVVENPGVQVLGVVDKDQVLHAHSGADAKYMTSVFREWIGTPTTFTLPECQRCGPGVTSLLAVHARKPYASAAGRETERVIERIGDPSTLAGRIRFEHDEIARRHGDSDGRLAVLLRHPGACVDLEFALGDTGTAYRTHGFAPYFRRPEIQVLRAWVAWATSNLASLTKADVGGCFAALAEFTGFDDGAEPQPAAQLSFWGLQQYVLGEDPAGFVSGQRPPARIDESEARFLPGLRRFVGALAGAAAPKDLPALFEALGFEAMCRRALVFDETVREAMRSARQFVASADRFASFDSWLKTLADNEAANAAKGGRSVVNLYSIAAAKGLEFDHVMLPDVEAGDFDGAHQEERNLFYVAVSRARHRLWISYRREPSSYLVQAAGHPATWSLGAPRQ